MNRPYKSTGVPAFGVFKEPKDASEYTTKKKASLLCNKIKNYKNQKCTPTQIEDYLNSVNLNYGDLNINLITKLNLENKRVISYNYTDPSNNLIKPGVSPASINKNLIPYISYVIDPSGQLFGNTPCGITNYTKYMVYNPSPFINPEL